MLFIARARVERFGVKSLNYVVIMLSLCYHYFINSNKPYDFLIMQSFPRLTPGETDSGELGFIL